MGPRYVLSDGTFRSEQGVLQKAGTPDEFLLVRGTFKWTAPDGQVTRVSYTADENGYHPKVTLGGGGPIVQALSASVIGTLIG